MGGSDRDFEHLFGSFHSFHSAKIIPRGIPVGEDRLAWFFPLSFPRLSTLEIRNYLPSSLSPVFTASNLTSLRTYPPDGIKPRYTLAQLSRILQKHPSLREPLLKNCPDPSWVRGKTGSLLPSMLVNLTLCDTAGHTRGLPSFVSTSAPLHDVHLSFPDPRDGRIPSLVKAVKNIPSAYRESFVVKSHQTPTSAPRRFDSCSASVP